MMEQTDDVKPQDNQPIEGLPEDVADEAEQNKATD